MMPELDRSPEHARIDGWKQISAYFGVKERAVQRWERDLGLPIHRERRKRGALIFAYQDELDAWRRGRLDIPSIEVTDSARLPVQSSPQLNKARFTRGVLFSSALVAVLLIWLFGKFGA